MGSEVREKSRMASRCLSPAQGWTEVLFPAPALQCRRLSVPVRRVAYRPLLQSTRGQEGISWQLSSPVVAQSSWEHRGGLYLSDPIRAFTPLFAACRPILVLSCVSCSPPPLPTHTHSRCVFLQLDQPSDSDGISNTSNNN